MHQKDVAMRASQRSGSAKATTQNKWQRWSTNNNKYDNQVDTENDTHDTEILKKFTMMRCFPTYPPRSPHLVPAHPVDLNYSPAVVQLNARLGPPVKYVGRKNAFNEHQDSIRLHAQTLAKRDCQQLPATNLRAPKNHNRINRRCSRNKKRDP